MAKKRANGEGTLVKTKTGFRGAISYKDINGSSKRKQFYGKTQKEVKEKMDSFKSKLNSGILDFDDNLTLEKWFYRWLFEFRKNDLKPSSFERYEGIYRNYIKGSFIGKIKLVELRTIHIQKYYNDLISEKNKSSTTIKSINKYLKSCLSAAVKENYILKNWCSNVTIPKDTIEKNDESYLSFSIEEQKLFLSLIKDHRLYALFLIAFSTGLRQGELLALNWHDIDFVSNTININKSIKRVTITKSDGSKESIQLIQSPKTKSSIRTVPIPTNIISELKFHQSRQSLEKALCGNAYEDNNLVFATPLGTPIDSRNLTKAYKRLLIKHNIPYKKFHSIRHSYATRLFEANVPIKTIQTLMGHSSITVTMNIYTHVNETLKVKAIDAINNIFEI